MSRLTPKQLLNRSQRPSSTPGWIVIYGDTMGLLLCVFILLVSMSRLPRDERSREVVGAVREAFGGNRSIAAVRSAVEPGQHPLIARLIRWSEGLAPTDIGCGFEEFDLATGSLEVIAEPGGFRISTLASAWDATSKMQLSEAGVTALREAGASLSDYDGRVIVCGHATASPGELEVDALVRSMSLARSVAVELIRGGIEGKRIALIAEAQEPGRDQESQPVNGSDQRVEIIITVRNLEGLVGSPPASPS